MRQRTGSIQTEIAIACAVLAFSVLLLPGLIYMVGGRLFGAYGGGGISALYRATLSDLWVPQLAAWLLLVTPTLCVVLVRLVIRLTRSGGKPGKDTAPAQKSRREPRLEA